MKMQESPLLRLSDCSVSISSRLVDLTGAALNTLSDSGTNLLRAWTVGGLAIRHALTLGLHVRSEASDLSDYDKEIRVRLWWSLYSLECLLNGLTGRPSCISDQDISTPLPMNINEEDFLPERHLYDTTNENSHSGPTSGPSSRRGSKNSKELRRQLYC